MEIKVKIGYTVLASKLYVTNIMSKLLHKVNWAARRLGVMLISIYLAGYVYVIDTH